MPDHLHELLVAACYRWHAAAGAVGKFGEDLVVAVDVDVIDLGVIHERL